MFISVVPNRNSKPAILLRETYREDGKVKNRTLANLSQWSPEKIAALAAALDSARNDGPSGGEVVGTVPHGHVLAVLGTARRLGMDTMLLARQCRERDLALAMIVGRVLDPSSKLALARELGAVRTSTLGEALDLGTVKVEELYKAMDWLLAHQEAIENKLAKRHLQDGALLLYDLTTVFLEGTTCELGAYGHGKEHRNDKLQIVVGLLCSREGIPISVQVFKGNASECGTLGEQVAKVQERFGLKQVIFVADRGILRSARIKDDLLPSELDWVTALRRPAINDLIKRGAFQPSLFEEVDLAEISDPAYPGERLMVCRNPILAEERNRRRAELLDRTERELRVIQGTVDRPKKPLQGAGEIGKKVGAVLAHYQTGRFFDLRITDLCFSFHRKARFIEEDTALDGFYVIRTSVGPETLTAAEAVKAYKELSHVETAFRLLKTVDLEIRPIYHALSDRVRAHAFLCMLAYYLEWHMRRDLAPLLFAEEDPEARQATRKTIVSPTRATPVALTKRNKKVTADGFPVQDFRGVLNTLATQTQQIVQPGIPKLPTFRRLTPATPYQKRAFELLQVTAL
jgi:transposase